MRILIVGARPDGHGKVVLEILQAMQCFEVAGFVDDDPEKRKLLIRGLPVVGTTRDLQRIHQDLGVEGAIVAIADNPKRRALGERILEIGLELVNAIHPTVHLDSDVLLGKGVVLCQGVIVVTGTRIGNSVNVHTGTTIDHDNVIEDGANLGPGVHTAGRVHICRDAFIGTGTVFIPDITVGEGAIVGAGSVLIRPVKPFDKVVGIPARSIAQRSSKEQSK